MPTFEDSQTSLFGDDTPETPKLHGDSYAYHIFRQRGAPTWTARHHRMIFSDPIPADEAVQRVATGLSCYVEVDGLQTAIEHLAQLGVVVNVDTPGAGKRGM